MSTPRPARFPACSKREPSYIRKPNREAADIRQEAVYSAHEVTEEQKRRMEEFKDTLWERVYKDGGLFQRFQLKYIYFL